MKRIQAMNYVIENARFSEDAPLEYCYFVRFPTRNSTKVFFAGETSELVEKVYKFANQTPEGRKLAEKIGKDEYLECATDEFEDENGDE